MTLATALLLATLASADEPMKFKIPPGWVDLSPGAPEANFAGFPPQLVKEAKSGKYAVIAFDLARATPAFAANVNAMVLDGPVSPDEPAMAAFLKDYLAKARQRGLAPTVLEASLREVDGVTWGVFVTRMPSGPLTVRQMTWLIPAGKRHGELTWSAEDSRFEEYRALFEQTSLATTGARAAPRFDWPAIALWSGLGAAVAVALALWRGKR